MAVFFNQAVLSYNNNVTSSNIVTGEIIEPLTVTKSAIPEVYRSGDDVTYLISIVNNGTTEYTGLTVTDDLGRFTPTAGGTEVTPLTYDADSVRYYRNGVLQGPPTVTDTNPFTVSGISVPAGGNALVVYSATLNDFADLSSGATLVNTATLSGGGLVTPITADNSISAVQGATLTVTKAISPTTVEEDGEITYTFVIQNFGNTATAVSDNVILTDTFNPVLDLTGVTFNGQPWTLGDQYQYSGGVFTTTANAITVPAATFSRDQGTGALVTTPGTATLVVSGTV